MYSNVLIPTDGSTGTEKAVKNAVEIARKYGATLHVLYVVNTNYPRIGLQGAIVETEKIAEKRREEGERAVREVTNKAREEGLEVVENVLDGIPHETILEYAEGNDIDLIVMGTHGRKGVDRFLMGSVTEKVVRMSKIPVLTVRMG